MKVSEVGVSTSSSSAGQNEDPNQVIVSGVGGDTLNQEEGQRTLSTEEIVALEALMMTILRQMRLLGQQERGRKGALKCI